MCSTQTPNAHKGEITFTTKANIHCAPSKGRALGGLTFRSSRSQMAAAPQMVESFDESKCLERLKANKGQQSQEGICTHPPTPHCLLEKKDFVSGSNKALRLCAVLYVFVGGVVKCVLLCVLLCRKGAYTEENFP